MRKAGTIVQVVLALVLVLYAVDWMAFRYHAAHGRGYGTINVEQYLATPLKGNKAEYDYMGTAPQSCSVSLFPQAGDVPCWWLQRHTAHWQSS